jgi:hypothetical protein
MMQGRQGFFTEYPGLYDFLDNVKAVTNWQ